jgi:hypothetical protein
MGCSGNHHSRREVKSAYRAIFEHLRELARNALKCERANPSSSDNRPNTRSELHRRKNDCLKSMGCRRNHHSCPEVKSADRAIFEHLRSIGEKWLGCLAAVFIRIGDAR